MANDRHSLLETHVVERRSVISKKRLDIVIDKHDLRLTLTPSDFGSEKAVIEEGLRLLAEVHGQRSIRRVRGKNVFDGDPPTKKGMK